MEVGAINPQPPGSLRGDSLGVQAGRSVDQSLAARAYSRGGLLRERSGSTKTSAERFVELLPMSYAVNFGLGFSPLNFFTPSQCVPKEKKHRPAAKKQTFSCL